MTRTRLIELTCESTSPDVAAQFLNAMAHEFVEDNSHSRITDRAKDQRMAGRADRRNQIAGQDAEEKLRDFVAASGNVFAGQDATLETPSWPAQRRTGQDPNRAHRPPDAL